MLLDNPSTDAKINESGEACAAANALVRIQGIP
jgi:hypothetical protein